MISQARYGRVLLFFLACLLVGCGSSPTLHYYTLSADAPASGGAGDSAGLRIAVGPITLPEVVDRPQLVIRTGANQVTLIEEHRWAESLKSQIPRVIAENLGRLLGTVQIWAYPQLPSGPMDYRVSINIQRFESVPGQTVNIDALWSIQQPSHSDENSKIGWSAVQQPVGGQGYNTLATAHSRALAVISGEIAKAIHSSP